MKNFLSIIFTCLLAQLSWAQSGENYDPENPADPDVHYKLMVEASPKKGGSITPSSIKQLQAGTEIYCSATANAGYKFKQWMVGNEIVSTKNSFTYTMPDDNVKLIAYFDWIGNEGYNPENPGDPSANGYQHKVTLYATPSAGGSFNSSSFYLTEDDIAEVYAYPSSGYRFVSWKQNGKIVSTGNPIRIIMGTEDQEYTAQFVYDPQDPQNPGANNFNAATGELIIDDFQPGNLNSTISATIGGSDNYPLVQSVVIIGQMESYDFGFSYNLTNCSTIDISRTTGYTEIPSWGFEGMQALTKIILPSSIRQIGNKAFSGCCNLSELVCYATVPPTLSPEAFDSFLGVTVRVPSVALSLYKEAEVWKKLTILPLDEETYQLDVSLPDDAADGRYKNMTLELNNISSGQILKYIITDRTTYTFANLISNTKYNILVKSASNSVLGTIYDVIIEDKDVSVTFESLLQPQNVVAKVVTPENIDVTSQTTVRWYDEEGKYLSQGAELNGVIEGSVISCQFSLSKDIAMQYIEPQDVTYTIGASDNNIVMSLQPFGERILSGMVKDKTTGTGIYNATVTISQTLNGKHSKSVVAKTDTTGAFSTTVYNAACDIVVAANEYISQIIQFDELSNIETLSNILLESISGARINMTFTYTPSVLEGESSEVQDGFEDYTNVSYTIYNNTAQTAINNFHVQFPYIVLLEEVCEGDVLNITATSRTKAFKDVTANGIVDTNNRVEVAFPIVELGKLQATYNQSASRDIVGILYNAKGELLNSSSYNDSILTFNDLEDGIYTLVTMENCDFFNSVLNLCELGNTGLVEGIHFVKHDIAVHTGKITNLVINNVPEFDDSKFYYTGSNTQFTVNKQSVTVGNYVTLRATVDFKNEYADKVSNVKLVVDIPESCDFVDNSVMVGAGTSNYTVGKNRIIVELANINEIVRFCVKPNTGGFCNPNAFVQFTLDGKEVLQPIGTVEFKADQMKISVPEITSLTSVVINGIATADSEVRVYDNGVLVGTTHSLANGQWASKVELYKPYDWSCHSISAEIVSPDGMCYSTDTKRLEYWKNYKCLSKITMIYNGKSIEFDPIERTSNASTYSYIPGNSDFTFTAEFTDSDTSSVKNLEFIVLASDGTTRSLEPEYNEVKKLWVAKSQYSNSTKLPVNIAVKWWNNTDDIDNYGFLQEEANMLIEQNKRIANFWKKKDRVVITKDTQDSFAFKYVDEELENLEWIVSLRNYENTISLTDSMQFNYGNDGENWFSYHLSSDEDSLKVIIVDYKDQIAYDIVIKDKIYNKNQAPTRKLNITNVGTGVVGNLLEIMGILDYLNVNTDLRTMQDYMNQTSILHSMKSQETIKLLDAKCKNGDKRITPTVESLFRIDLAYIIDEQNNYLNTFEKFIDEYRSRLSWNIGLFIASLGIGQKLNALIKGGLSSKLGSHLLSSMGHGKTWWAYNSQSVAESIVENIGEIAYNGVDNIFTPDFSDFTEQRNKIWSWAPSASNAIMKEYAELIDKIKRAYRTCPEKEDDDKDDKEDDFPLPPLIPSIDPAGYVYESVSSNRIEGVTASCYYKEFVEDMYGDLHENITLWNAEEFAQENPLFTDKNGMYQWFVPQGLWQVKFEKEGYETTYSEWLPVPPPQLEVNIPMVHNKQPEVANVHAYEEGIEVEFDKYMMPDYLTTDNIKVCQDGKYIDGKVVLVDEEISYLDENVKYASCVRFIPNTAFLAGQEATLIVANKVKSYAGIQMAENFTQSFDIEKEVKKFVVDSLIQVPYRGSRIVTIYVLPADAAAGKTMHAVSSSEMIASLIQNDVTIDKNGIAQFEIKGELPGTAEITFIINGVNIDTTLIANVGNFEESTISEPKASIASGSSVYRGTTIKLTSDNKDMKIWYTTDGTCPCDDFGSRKQYTVPIVINSDITIRAIAENEDGETSDVATFIYNILQSKTGIALNIGWNWISFNMKNESMTSVNTALASGSWISNDVIKDNRHVDMYSANQDLWFGTLSKYSALNNTQMYKIRSSKEQVLALTGEAVNPAETAITVTSGWNFISYLPLISMDVSDALKGYRAENGDVIKSQDAFAIYSVTNGWEGDLTKLVPGRGYMLKRASNASQTTFNYPIETPIASVEDSAAPAKSYQYSDNMNIVGLIEGIVIEDGDSLMAYVNGEIRGSSRLERDKKVFLTVHGDDEANIALVLQRNGEIVATASNMFGYQCNNILGSADVPTAIKFVTEKLNNTDGIGNIKAIYNINGIKMKTRRLSNIPSGTYIIYSEKNGNTCITKLNK